MIRLLDVTHLSRGTGQPTKVLDSTSIEIPSNRKVALLGPSEPEKKALINLIGGVVMPEVGCVHRLVKVSFPVGHSGGYNLDISVRKNVAHIARLYNADVPSVVEFVRHVTDLGDAFEKPYRDLNHTGKAIVGQVMAYSIPFDVYVLSFAGKWARTEVKARALFSERARTSGMVVATQDAAFVNAECDAAMVLQDGRLRWFDDVGQALSVAGEMKP